MRHAPFRAADLGVTPVLMSTAAAGCSTGSDSAATPTLLAQISPQHAFVVRNVEFRHRDARAVRVRRGATQEPIQAAKGLRLPGRIVFRRYSDASEASASLSAHATIRAPPFTRQASTHVRPTSVPGPRDLVGLPGAGWVQRQHR